MITDVALPVFALYMMIACNFLKEVLGCGLQTLLDTNMYAKHMVAIILLYFLIVVVSPENADKNIGRNLLITLVVYAWFLMTARTPHYIMIIVLVLLLGSYITGIAKKRYTEEKNTQEADKSAKLQKGLAVAALLLSVFGFIMYVVEKRLEYKSKFKWSTFFSGNVRCRNYTPDNVKVLPSMS